MAPGAGASEAASELHDEISGKVNCPICLQDFDNLDLLNRHLDNDHGFGGPETTSVGNGNGRSHKKHNKRERATKSHLKPFENGHSRCHECNQRIKKSDEGQNCMKCGEIFCKRHCQNLMKLNSQGRYDPTKGKWRICCYKCFSERPGYNDYGSVRDLTSSFKKLRNLKNEDKQLQILHLENRLVRLVDGVAAILRSNENRLWGNFTVNSEVAKFERTVTAWQDDKHVSNCSICDQCFGLLLRKHHCRLCGNVVCDSEASNCSNAVPIQNLVNAADDISFTAQRSELVKLNTPVRVCSKCTHNLYYGRKFRKDVTQPLSPLLSQCEKIQNLSRSILNVLTLLTTSLEELGRRENTGQINTPSSINESTKLKAKLLRAVASYTQLAKGIAILQPRNTAEKKIQQSMRMASSTFINEKLIHMRSLSIPTSMGSPQVIQQPDLPAVKPFKLIYNNLSIKEVKQHREELMVLKEQKFLVETMMENAKKQRNFDEISTLTSNLKELESRISTIQEGLGEEGFA